VLVLGMDWLPDEEPARHCNEIEPGGVLRQMLCRVLVLLDDECPEKCNDGRPGGEMLRVREIGDDPMP